MPQHRLTLLSPCTLPAALDFNVWIFSNTRLTFLLVVSSLSLLLQSKTQVHVFTWMVWKCQAPSLSSCVCMCGLDQSLIPEISEKNALALCLRGAHKLSCITLWPAHTNYCFLLTSHMSRNVCLSADADAHMFSGRSSDTWGKSTEHWVAAMR